MRLTILFFLLSICGFSQQITLGNLDSIQNYSLDPNNKQFYIFFKNRYEKLDLKTFERTSKKVFIPSEFNFKGYVPMRIDTTQYFVSEHGGLVYVMKNDSIYRIDKSFDHRMQNSSIVFEHDSKLIKYGGYGFWSSRNFFTYFDEKSKEWEVISPVNSTNMPDGTHDGNFIKNGNDIYLFNGLKVNPYDRIQFIKNDEVWKYNLKDNIWTYLGKTSKKEFNSFFLNERLISFEDHQLHEIDIANNKMITYRRRPLGKMAFIRSHYRSLFAGLNPFLLDDKIYFLSGTNDNNHVLNAVDQKEFFGDQIAVTAFYKNNYWYGARLLILLSVIVLFVVSVILALKYHKKRNKIRLLDNGIRFKNKFTEFDNESMEIIKSLLSQNEVSSNTILQMVEKDQYSAAHNE
ncbi:MAG: hypothetical protein KJO83_00675, partial [Bacteroidia bacterium]|nr:hypothetical protein [Bacteroidia bacterium]